MKRYAFIVPRFGEGIMGGAETLVGELALELQKRGDQVEIWTTCARDNRTWENFYEAGTTTELELTVTRFPVDERDLDRWIPLQIRISEGLSLTTEEQLEWMTESIHSKALYEHIARCGPGMDAMFFAPYLFGTTFFGSLICPERSVLIPCLHDEAYAYLEIMQALFKRVRGALFNALPEYHLAQKLYGGVRGGECGKGFMPPVEEDLSPYFEKDASYFVYVGRKETGKNAHLLIDYFRAAKERGDLSPDVKLVLVGGGDMSDLHRPDALLSGDIIDPGYVSEQEKRSILKYATALVQPSVNESFSIVLFEAWQVGTPVLVHGACQVTRHHVVESGGGLYFSDSTEFGAVAKRLVSDAPLTDALAASGRAYVDTRYDWSAVLARFDAVMEALFDGELQESPSV